MKSKQVMDWHALVTSENVSSLTLSLLSLFYAAKVLTLLHFIYFPIRYRVNYAEYFEAAITGSAIYDDVIILCLGLATVILTARRWKELTAISAAIVGISVATLQAAPAVMNIFSLLTFPTVFGLVLWGSISRSRVWKVRISLRTFIFTTALVFLAFEAAALARWIAYPVFPGTVYGDWTWTASITESRLFHATALALSVVSLLALFSFVYKPVLRNVLASRSATKIGKYLFGLNKILDPADQIGSVKIHRILLISSFAFSTVFAIYPYLPIVNPTFQNAGTDVGQYLDFNERLALAPDTGSFLHLLFVEIDDGDRPFSLILFYTIQQLSTYPTVQFLPVILGPALITSVYYFVKYGAGNKLVAATSALFTVFSFHFMVGMYAGFFANWLALVAGYFSFLFVLKSWEKPELKYLVILGFLTIAMLFTHVYTWSYAIAVMILFVAMSYFVNRRKPCSLTKLYGLVSVIVVNLVVDAVRTFYLNSAGGLESDLVLAQNLIGIEQFDLRWNNLTYLFTIYVGGYFANAVMLVMALIWMLKARPESNFDRLLMASLFVIVLPVIFGNYVMQTRLFYDVPIHVMAAIIFYRMVVNYRSHPALAPIFSTAVVLYFLNYAARSMTNLYFIAPQ